MQTSRLALTSLGFLASAFLVVPSVCAQEETKTTDVKALIEEFENANREWTQNYRDATREERVKMRQTRPKPQKWLPKFKKVIEVDPKAESAMAAANWIVTRGRASGADLEQVLGVVLAHHVESDNIAGICSALTRAPQPMVEKFLRTVQSKNPHPEVQGQAVFSHAQLLKYKSGLVRSIKTATDKRMESLVRIHGSETVDVLKSADPDEMDKTAGALFEKVVGTPEFASLKARRTTLAAAAKTNLFELRNLSIGKVAPQIDGEDIDGNAMKLTDYRGKVVVLDFWGDW